MAEQEQADRQPTPIVWEGDSREVLRSFPKKIRIDFGLDIRRLQDGDLPLDSRPMRSIGRGVFELRQSDQNGWYRIIYLQKIAGRLFMLHSFVKKSARTSQRDLNVARQRMSAVRERLAKEKKDAEE